MTESEFKPMHYTRLHHGEIRRQMRDALEKFEPPQSDLPPAISARGNLTYRLPFPAAPAYAALMKLLIENKLGVAAHDDAAYRLTLGSGVCLEFWPTEDGMTRLECGDIFVPGDDLATGARFRDTVSAIALLDQRREMLQAQAAEAHLVAREDALQRQFSEAQLADLAGAVAALKAAGFRVTLPNTSAQDFVVLVSRPLGYTQSFTTLNALLVFALQAAPPSEPARTTTQKTTPSKARGRSPVSVTRKSGSKLSILLLIIGLALLGLLYFYPWPF